MTQAQLVEKYGFVKTYVRNVPDFPKPGIMFKDITPLLRNHSAFKASIDYFEDLFKNKQIDYVAGIESRGFILGAPLADRLGAGLILVRKHGKLPADTIKVSYELEYGYDSVEIHKDALEPGKTVVIIDDLLATGGTASATAKLIQMAGGDLVGAAFLIELIELNGKEKFPLNLSLHSLIQY